MTAHDLPPSYEEAIKTPRPSEVPQAHLSPYHTPSAPPVHPPTVTTITIPQQVDQTWAEVPQHSYPEPVLSPINRQQGCGYCRCIYFIIFSIVFIVILVYIIASASSMFR